MCLNDISNDPRPLRTIKTLNRSNYQVDILSWPNTYNIKKYYIKHYIIYSNSKTVYKKLLKRILKFIQPILRIPNINQTLIELLFDLYRFKHIYNIYDIIIIEDIEFLPIVAIKKCKYKLIFDMREYYPLQRENNTLFNVFERPYRHWICKNYLNTCDSLYTVSKGLADRYSSTYNVDVSIIKSVPNKQSLFPNNHASDKIKMVHHGIANTNRKIENMIYLMNLLDNRFSLDLYLTGIKKNIGNLVDISSNYNQVKILPSVPFENIIQTLNTYDIGIFYNEPTTFNLKHCLPNKLFEFIQARLVVAIGPSPDMAEIVHEYECGVVSEEFSIESMANILNSLTPEKIMFYKSNSHIAANNLNFETESKKLMNLIENTFNGQLMT